MKANFETGMKICGHCKKEYPLSEYYKNKSMTDGLSWNCAECEIDRKGRSREASNKKQRDRYRTDSLYRGKKVQAAHKSNESNSLENNEIFQDLKDDPEFKALQMFL